MGSRLKTILLTNFIFINYRGQTLKRKNLVFSSNLKFFRFINKK